jgi:pimeloyl-ACP methyl ester carboxylesterase
MATAAVNHVSLEYEESGAGEPVVLVHGGVSDHRIWQAQRLALGHQYRAIAYSCRYHWPNDPASPGAEHSVAIHVEDLRALVRTLAAGPVHLVGNSFGGLLCLLVAIRAPELVRSLVLLEPFVLPFFVSLPPKPLGLLRLAMRHPRMAAAVVQFGAGGLGPAQAAFKRGDLERGLQLFMGAVLGPYGADRMTPARRTQARDNLETFAAQLVHTDFALLDQEELRHVTVPTLLLSGEQSPPLMRLLVDRLHELLPCAERVDIPDASHDAHVDNPDAVTSAILTFLRRCGGVQFETRETSGT